ncbi:MAG TPA: hypothetical protein EYP65_01790 [Armatimonadetes bacterium]|nr:hypothetical protein [Armatimonadota bacterium]
MRVEPIQVGRAEIRSVEDLIAFHRRIRPYILRRLAEFKKSFEEGNEAIFEELVFCILAAGASARMGVRGVEALRGVLLSAPAEELAERLQGLHLYPASRAKYIAETRDYLASKFRFRLKELILSFDDAMGRRDFFAKNRHIKGIGYKGASHFLRNIGFSGYAILDKHVLRGLAGLGVIEGGRPPSTRRQYLEIESKMREFAERVGIPLDEMDFVLWAARTGMILK